MQSINIINIPPGNIMAKPSFSELQKTQAEVLQSLADIKDIKAMDALMSKLKKVKEDLGKYEEERAATIGEISSAIVESEVKFSELSEAARQVLGYVSGAGKAARKPRGPNTKKTGELLIEFKTGSRPVQYHKGQKIPQTISKTLTSFYQADPAGFDKAFENSYTEAGKAYFETADGKAELKAYVDAIKGNKPASSKGKKKTT